MKIKYPPHCPTNFLCNHTCEFGYKLNGNRCPTCECYNKSIENFSSACDHDLMYMALNDRLCKCTKHCRINCNHVHCPYGYEKASNGCDICKCKGLLREILKVSLFFCKFIIFSSRNSPSKYMQRFGKK